MARLDPTGEHIRFSTLLGGSGLDDVETLATDDDGNTYVAGRTTSPDFPTTDGVVQRTLIPDCRMVSWRSLIARDTWSGPHWFHSRSLPSR